MLEPESGLFSELIFKIKLHSLYGLGLRTVLIIK